jgi:uncharacterized DUF497 family protein
MKLQFDWDEGKRRANLAKHGVDFLEAAAIFDNPTLEKLDDREDYGEERLVAIGRCRAEILRVVYTDREEVRRIISAQKATRRQREEYYRLVFS